MMALFLGPEPLLEVNNPKIAALARRLRGSDTDPRVVAERINRWVYDSLRKSITIGVPSALATLEAGRGDCNEHTQLAVALSRAAGIPARVAAGLAYVDGKFYYHAWPEIWLERWVASDPTFGQFPADAAHLRLDRRWARTAGRAAAAHGAAQDSGFVVKLSDRGSGDPGVGES